MASPVVQQGYLLLADISGRGVTFATNDRKGLSVRFK
jgi:hypothetical protein